MITIVNWWSQYENATTRKLVSPKWFFSQSGNQSQGYRLLMRHQEDGVLSLGLFQALCQSMATLPIDVRKTGTFFRTSMEPMDLDDLIELTRAPFESFEIALPLLSQIGWVEMDSSRLPFVSHSSPIPKSPEVGRSLGDGREIIEGSLGNRSQLPDKEPSPSHIPVTSQSPPGFTTRRGGEGIGEEGKRRGGDTRENSPPPPDFDEILKNLASAFPNLPTRLSPQEENYLQLSAETLAEEMTIEHWIALQKWMAASDRQRGRHLFPRDRAEFLRAPIESIQAFWPWWKNGAKDRFRRPAQKPKAAAEENPALPPEEIKKILQDKS